MHFHNDSFTYHVKHAAVLVFLPWRGGLPSQSIHSTQAIVGKSQRGELSRPAMWLMSMRVTNLGFRRLLRCASLPVGSSKFGPAPGRGLARRLEI